MLMCDIMCAAPIECCTMAMDLEYGEGYFTQEDLEVDYENFAREYMEYPRWMVADFAREAEEAAAKEALEGGRGRMVEVIRTTRALRQAAARREGF